MDVVFYVSAAIAVLSTTMVIVQTNAVHALLYLVMSLLAVAVVFYVLGAPFVAALEVIVYAGAIMILFVFVIMMLNIGPQSADQEGKWLASQVWVGPALLSVLLIAELVYVIAARSARPTAGLIVAPKQVGIALFGPYLLGVELASMVLLSGLVGAYHLGRRARAPLREPGELPEMAGRDGRGQETKRAQVAPAPQQAPRVKVH